MKISIEEITQLQDGQGVNFNIGDGNMAEVWFKNNTYFLFEMTAMREHPMFVGAYSAYSHPEIAANQIVETVNSWT